MTFLLASGAHRGEPQHFTEGHADNEPRDQLYRFIHARPQEVCEPEHDKNGDGSCDQLFSRDSPPQSAVVQGKGAPDTRPPNAAAFTPGGPRQPRSRSRE